MSHVKRTTKSDRWVTTGASADGLVRERCRCARIGIVGTAAAIPDHRPVRADQGVCPSLAHPVRLYQVGHHFPHCGGRYRFRDRRSFSATLSSVGSTSGRFSFAFYSSTAFSRFAPETSMPSYFDVHA
jgi:hypothetical protein